MIDFEKIINETTSELDKIPVEELAKLWCDFNKWKFPKIIEHVKPESWDSWVGRDREEKRGAVCFPVMAYIRDKIGFKACIREWNREMMTDEEFEEFYKSQFGNKDFK